jgi:hypothetical protein
MMGFNEGIVSIERQIDDLRKASERCIQEISNNQNLRPDHSGPYRTSHSREIEELILRLLAEAIAAEDSTSPCRVSPPFKTESPKQKLKPMEYTRTRNEGRYRSKIAPPPYPIWNVLPICLSVCLFACLDVCVYFCLSSLIQCKGAQLDYGHRRILRENVFL